MRRAGLAGALLPALLMLVLFPGCGYGLLQTADTTPKGRFSAVVGGGYVHNELIEERGFSPSNIPLQWSLRYGLSDTTDIGISQFMSRGALIDAKHRLIPRARPFAVALRGGAGFAYIDDSPSYALHVPITLIASYREDAVVAPYAALGYGAYWIFGRSPPAATDGGELAPRAGYGDGNLTLTGGLRFSVTPRVSFLVEYNYWKALVDDPGDFYSFVDNHIFMFGVRF